MQTEQDQLKTQLEIEPMFADAKREGCGIAWKLKLLCWASKDCCELVPSPETKSGAFGLKVIPLFCIAHPYCA